MESNQNKPEAWKVIRFGLEAMARTRGISIEEAARIASQDAIQAGEPDYVEQINLAIDHLQDEPFED